MNPEWTEQPKSKVLPGAQLAAQREAMGLSVDQIADQLKLAPRQVVALEADDYDSLPNMAVTRGFVRAYAKVVKLDAAPLVAMIEVNPMAGHEQTQTVRRDISASFTESRFPTMTERSGKPSGWLLGVAGAAVIAAAVGAYYVGLFPNLAPGRKDAAPAPAASAPVAAPAIAVLPAGTAPAPLQSPNVPLISVAPPVDPNAPVSAPATQPAPQGVTPAAPAAAPAPVNTAQTTPPAAAGTPVGAAAKPAAPAVAVPAAGQPAGAAAAVKPGAQPAVQTAQAVQPATPSAQPVAATGSKLVLTATDDSWITIQPPGKKALVSRLLKAGSSETFDVPEPALLIVGKPTHVKATLHGAALELPPVPGGTISRVTIK
ncbi:MAG: helix-turn-helix domain-containing protein [Burkholderiaceae bacterium]|nr:helix-turn-helix domain-containing protein [Burkholderiaceae bacterium]